MAEPEPLRDEDPDIAAIDRVVPFPLRLPAAGLARLVVQLGEDVVGVARDRRLLRWCGVGGGARQLLDQLPPGRVLLVEAVDDVLHVAVGPIGSRGPIWIRRDLRTEVAEIDRLPDELSAVSCIALSGGVLIVFQRPDVVCFEPRRPDALHRMRLPDGFAWLGRGYFRSRRGVRQLVLTNNGPIFERVSSDVDAVRIATAVDSDKSHCEAVRRGPTPRWRFKAIGQTVDGKLALVGSLETLALVVSHERFAWHRLRSAAALIGVQHFTRGRGWGGIRRSRARWPDGRRATVDSRGLLHLQQGGDPSELSIVLSSWGPTAAWTVGGGCIGDRRFIDGEASAELFDTVDERIRRFIGGAS